MVLCNALGVVMMVAYPPVGAAASDVASDVEATVAAEPALAAEPADVEAEPEVEAEPTLEGEPELLAEPALAPDPALEPELAVVEPEPEDEPPNTRWRGGPYFTFGVAPMATMDVHANVHPGLRYDMEVGLAWKRGRVRAYFGPDFHLMQYFGRKKAGFGVDAMATVTLRHVYARAGVGAAMGMPAGPDVNDTRPMLGGLVGGGLVGRLDKAEGRLGVDYDLRVDTSGRVAQTVLLTLRLTFGP